MAKPRRAMLQPDPRHLRNQVVTDVRPDYEYDVFVSYRRYEFVLKWIGQEFIDLFRLRLELELGRHPRIFWDDQAVDDSTVPTEAVIHALRTSKCLLPILSGPYFSSKWCCAEWHTFRQRASLVRLDAGKTLTLPVHWHDGDNYMPLLEGQGPRPADFSDFQFLGPAWRTTAAFNEFESKMKKLVETVARMIMFAPPFDPAWPLVEPATIIPDQQSPGTWNFRFSAGSSQARSW